MIIYISLESLLSMTRLWSSGYDRGFPTIFAGIAKIRKQPLTRVRIPAAASNYMGYIQKPQDQVNLKVGHHYVHFSIRKTINIMIIIVIMGRQSFYNTPTTHLSNACPIQIIMACRKIKEWTSISPE